MYRIFRGSNGIVDAINKISNGASLPYNYQTKTFNESHPLVIELRQWEQETGTPLDLSDHPPDPVPPPELNWSELLNAMNNAALFTRIYASSTSNLQTNSAFGFLMFCLTSLHNPDNLQLALTDLQTHIQPAFSEGEIDFVNQALLNNNFTFQLNINN